MGTGYTRNDTTNNIADGNVINAADLDGEFDAIVTALSTGGHTHDGTAAEGGPVTVLGPAQDFVVTASIVSPKTDNTLDLGTSTLEFKDIYIDGTAYIDGLGEDILVAGTSKIQFTNTSNYIHSASAGNIDLVAATEIHLTATTINMDGAADISGNLGVGGNLTVTGTTTFNGGTITLGDAAADNIVFGADVDSSIIPDDDDTYDLGSSGQQWRDIYINGSAYIDGLAEDILVATDKKIQFRDAGLLINSSTNGQLDIDADVELEITAPTVDINASTAVLISNDLKLDSDAAVLSFGASSEVTITHVADTGLTLTHTGTGDNTPIVLQLKSEENAVIADEVLGSIEFAAGDDSGTDAATVAAGIHAIAEAEFTSSANATKLVFTTGVSETAAASATAKMTLSSAGLLTIADDFMLKDGGTIGVASTNDAITIASTGIVTFKDDILIKDAGTIGSASDPDAIAISSAGVVAISSTTAASSSTSGALTVAGGVGIAADLHVGDDLVVTGDATFNGDTHTFASANSTDPVLIIKNTTNDTNGSRLHFVKDKGAAGADGDDIGVIEFISDDADQAQTSFAKIVAEVSESLGGDEAGKLSFFVAESDSTNTALTAGLVIEGEHATDGEVDVTIAAGTASTTTVAGDLAVTTDATVGGTLDTTGAVNLNLVTDSTSSTSGALIVDGGVGIAKKLFVGTDFDVSGDAVIDGTALVTGVLTTTAATVFNGGFASNAASTITTADNTAQLTLISTDADANAGPKLKLRRNSASPADDDLIGSLDWTSENSDGDEHDFLNLTARMRDVTAGSEDVAYAWTAYLGGTGREIQSFVNTDASAASMVFNEDSQDIDFRVESNGNANMLFVDGGNNRVGIGTNTPQVGTLHVHTATAGTVTASPQADDLVVESNTEAGITILSPDDQTARIRFSSPSTNTEVGGATIFYRQNINKMKIGTAVAGGVLGLVSAADTEALTLDASGNVIIASTGGTLQTATAGSNNLRIGLNAGDGILSGGNQNVAVGDYAGTAITTGDSNTAVGYNALASEDTGNGNTAIGHSSFANLNKATSAFNVGVGANSGINTTSASANTFVGGDSGVYSTTGDSNTFIGFRAGEGLDGTPLTGDNNVAVGRGAGEDLQGVAHSNVFVGKDAGMEVTVGFENTLIGHQAGDDLEDSDRNTAVGAYALHTEVAGQYSTAVGYAALNSQTNASAANVYNVAVGYSAGQNITDGTLNTFVGALAGDATDDGTENTGIGYLALSANCGAGNTAVGSGSGRLVTGAANTTMGVSSGYELTSGSNNLILGQDAGRSTSPGGAIDSGGNTITLGNNSIATANVKVDWTIPSDQRDKTDFTALDIGLDFVKALNPVTYKWDQRSDYGDQDADDWSLSDQTPDGTHKKDWLDLGFKAQEVEALEIAAGYNKANKTNLTVSLNPDGKQYGMRYSKFVPILVKAIQEQNALIEALTARVATLEG